MNQCEQQQAAFVWKTTKKRLRFLWIKNVPFFLFEKKQQPVAKWFPYSVFFFCFFFFSSLLLLLLCQFLFLPSSFKVNLKVHNRNWRVFLLLVPMERRKKKNTQKTHTKKATRARARSSRRQFLWEIRLLPNSFE